MPRRRPCRGPARGCGRGLRRGGASPVRARPPGVLLRWCCPPAFLHGFGLPQGVQGAAEETGGGDRGVQAQQANRAGRAGGRAQDGGPQDLWVVGSSRRWTAAARAAPVIAEGARRPAATKNCSVPKARCWDPTTSKSAVRVILTNPRCTGHQVWAKQRKDEVLFDTAEVTVGQMPVMRWNPGDKWIYSSEPVHEAIIDKETFEQAQAVLAARGRGPKRQTGYRTTNHYAFKSALCCGLCNRKMQGRQSHGEPYCRCRFPDEYALANHVQHPRNVHVREADLVGPLDAWIARAFAPGSLERTLAAMVEAQRDDLSTATDGSAAEDARRVIRTSDEKIAQYRSVLEAGGDAKLVALWTNEVRAAKAEAQIRLKALPRPGAPMSGKQIKALVAKIADVATAISHAKIEVKTPVYQALGLRGLRGTYNPGENKVRVEVNLDPHLLSTTSPRGEMVGVRGGT
ncbi:recombinase family protein [Kitasatospora indigofera]|uniref:recombinase family protein n=1 Tax=Kitasatospora indigofera TaxID=67307 RepID=UPI00368FDC56